VADPKQNPSDSRAIGKYLNIGLLIPIATFVGFAMGYGLDWVFHTTWLRYVFLVLGTVAGFVEMIRDLNKDI
jgi:F0F1-type ATP synthase assembly protein I